MKKVIRSLRRSLKFDDREKMLLLVSIATDEMMRLCMMFPEVFYMDVTNNTNTNKKDLFVLVTKDSAGKSYTTNLMLLPSGKAWVFMCIYRHAMVDLYGKHTIERNRLVLVDEDYAEVTPLRNEIECSPTYKNTQVMLCVFHAVWKPFNENVKTHLPKKAGTDKLNKYGVLYGEWLCV